MRRYFAGNQALVLVFINILLNLVQVEDRFRLPALRGFSVLLADGLRTQVHDWVVLSTHTSLSVKQKTNDNVCDAHTRRTRLETCISYSGCFLTLFSVTFQS